MSIPEDYFIYISVFIILLYAVMMFFAYKRGFLYGVISIVYTLLALLLSYFASPVFASLFPLVKAEQLGSQFSLIGNIIDLDKLINTVAYFIIIFLILKVLYLFIELLLKSFNKIPVIGSFNQFLGLFIGFINATLITLALSMLLTLPVIRNGKEIREKTILRYINGISEEAVSLLFRNIGEKKFDLHFDVDSYREQFKEWLNDTFK